MYTAEYSGGTAEGSQTIMRQESDLRVLLYFLCVRIVSLAIVCVFAENMALWIYLLSPYSAVISVPQIVLMMKILGCTLLIIFAGIVALVFLENSSE